MRRRSCRIHKGCIALQFLEHGLVFLARFDGRNTEGNDLKAAQIAPFRREYVVKRVCHLHCVSWECGIADALLGDLGKSGLQRGQQFGLKLAFETVAGVIPADIAADIRIEQNWVADAVAVLAKASDGDIDVDTGALINHTERDGRGRAIFVADEVLRVEVIHALILGCLAAEGEALADVLEGVENVFA